MENGLSQNMVDCITKDKDNFIWIGTWNGLNRFDGYNFITYHNISNDTNSLVNNIIHSLYVDNYNNIWIATYKGICIYINHLNRFKRVNYITANINCVVADNNGNIWAGGDSIIEILRPVNPNGDFEILTEKYLNRELIKQNKYYSFCFDDNRTWIGCDKGVYIYNKKGKNLKKINTGIGAPNDLFENDTRQIVNGSDNNLWVATDVGLIRYNKKNKTAYYYGSDENDNNSLPNNSVSSIAIDISNNVIIGTLGGLSIYNKDEDNFINYTEDKWGYKSINNNFVNSLYAGSDGIIWIGTERGGLNKYSLNQKQFETIEYNPEFKKGLNNSTVNAILEDDKFIWIGTAGGGLNRFDKKSKTLKYYIHNENDLHSLTNNFVSYLSKDKTGNVYVAEWGGGMHKLKPENFENGRFDEVFQNRLPGNNYFISTIIIDDNNNLWLATIGGIIIYNPYKDEFKQFYSDDIAVGCMQFDNQGNLWIGSLSGLYFIKSDSNHDIDIENPDVYHFTNIPGDSTSISDNYVISFLLDDDDNMWIGTYEKGINKVMGFNDKGKIIVKRFNEKNNLSNSIIYNIQQDNHGNIWTSTGFGLSKLDPKNGKFRSYFESDGIANNEFYWTAGFKNNDGKMLFGGMNGITLFHPDSIKINENPPVLKLTSLKIYNIIVETGKKYDGIEVLKENITSAKEITFSYKSKEFTIGFAALHYEQPLQNKYKYKLEGYDNEWKMTEPNVRYASYTQLPGGRYTFKLRASNSDDIWTNEPLTLTINIIPPIYKTWWFRILIILLVITFTIAFYIIRVNALKKQKELLEKIVRERTKELQNKNQLLEKQTFELNETNTLLEEKQQKIEEQTVRLKTQAKDLSVKNEDLNTLNATKDKLFSIIAHDLKNPINNLLGFSKLMIDRYDTLDDSKLKNMLSIIYSSGKNIFDLMMNLLQWARNQLGNITVIPEKINLFDMVTCMKDVVENMLTMKNIVLNIEIPPELEITTDKNILDTILRNLITNSIKYTENGSITISAKINNSKVDINIKDTGIGMSPEQIVKIFLLDPKKSVPGTQGEKGTGLGLIICKDFLDKLNSELYIESEEGKGSTFTFSLPLS